MPSGRRVRQRLGKQKLLELAYLADAATKIMPSENANFWVLSPGKALSKESPDVRAHMGRYIDVLDIIKAEGVRVESHDRPRR